MNNKVDWVAHTEYKPKRPDMEKVKHYVNVDPTGCEMHAHERDVVTPKPVTLKPTTLTQENLSPDDVTNFPH